MTSATASERPAWLPASLFPFESHFQDVDGCCVHYIDEGDGPTLLLLHGNPTYSLLYRKIVAQLRGRFRCVALDYPGFGLSTAAAGYDYRPESHSRVVEHFAAALDLHELTIMVQDWGGPIGLGLAGRRPELVRALIIGNTWAWPTDAPSTVRFSKLMGSAVGQFAIERLNLFVRVILPGGVKRSKLAPEVLAAYRGPFLRPESRGPVALFPKEILDSHAYLAEVESGLAGLRERPCLIVWGDRDVAFKAAERERFEATFVRHRTHILHGAGHYIQEDAGEEIALAVRAWWDDEVPGQRVAV
jgi:haloalkane dehalogenase